MHFIHNFDWKRIKIKNEMSTTTTTSSINKLLKRHNHKNWYSCYSMAVELCLHGVRLVGAKNRQFMCIYSTFLFPMNSMVSFDSSKYGAINMSCNTTHADTDDPFDESQSWGKRERGREGDAEIRPHIRFQLFNLQSQSQMPTRM